MRDAQVTDDADYGRTAPALGWVPAPRYLLRRDAVLRIVRTLPAGRVLEFGAGAGTLLADLHALGHRCVAVEQSEDARRLAGRMIADLPISVHDAPQTGWQEQFDLVLAFEVLEHIEDDTAALRDWMAFLKQGGRLLLSVPAHAKRWTARDTWAGHFRRYDRADFVALAERCGARVVRCDNYAFPLGNLVEPISAWVYSRKLSPAERRGRVRDTGAARIAGTEQSGVERSAETRLYGLLTSLPGRLAMRAAMRVQRSFVSTELGNGFVLEAVKP